MQNFYREDELRIAERAGLSDIDTNAHTEYLISMRKKKPNLADLTNDKINSLQGFALDGKTETHHSRQTQE